MNHLIGQEHRKEFDPKQAQALLGQLADMMPQHPSVRDVAQRVLWLAGQIAWSDSSALFLIRDGKLEAEVFRSPHHEALTQVTSLGIQEPLVHRALKEQGPVCLEAQDQNRPRIFCDETQAIALPIHDYGVIYLGRRTGEAFGESVLATLTGLCQQAHFAILLAKQSVSRKALLLEEAESRQIADTLLNSVSSLVEVMSHLLVLSDPREVLHNTGHNLFRLANFEFWTIVAGKLEELQDPPYFLSGPNRHLAIDRVATLSLAKLVWESKRTLSFMQMDRLTLPRPSESIRSVLLCPMLAEGKVIGCLLVGCVRPSISRHERELLSTLALQVGSHFWNLHLHRELVETHRSLKLSQAQLIQSSKMAAVGQLAAGVAHEINTPLGAMNLAIEGAMRIFDKKPERALERLDRALKSGNQLKEIVSKLLHYSKKTTSVGQETDLNEVVKDSVSLVRHQLLLDNVTLQTDLAELARIVVNHNELQQVLVNLLTNAKDAVVTENGTDRAIVLRTWLEDGQVALSVKDAGTGMSSETLERAFEPFYTTKEVGRGTGLGLSVSKELVEQNGGRIEVASALGLGTEITLFFPL